MKRVTIKNGSHMQYRVEYWARRNRNIAKIKCWKDALAPSDVNWNKLKIEEMNT